MPLIDQDRLRLYLKDQAYKLLGRRDHSSAEVRQKLRQALEKYAAKTDRPIPDGAAAVEQVMADLARQHLLDDRKFAAGWVRGRQALRPRGKALLKQELRQKGVDQDIIRDVLDEQVDRDAEIDTARRLVAKRRGKSEEQNMRYLAGKGYAFDVIKRALSDPD